MSDDQTLGIYVHLGRADKSPGLFAAMDALKLLSFQTKLENDPKPGEMMWIQISTIRKEDKEDPIWVMIKKDQQRLQRSRNIYIYI